MSHKHRCDCKHIWTTVRASLPPSLTALIYLNIFFSLNCADCGCLQSHGINIQYSNLHPVGSNRPFNFSELPQVSILKLCGTLSAFWGHHLAVIILNNLFLWLTYLLDCRKLQKPSFLPRNKEPLEELSAFPPQGPGPKLISGGIILPPKAPCSGGSAFLKYRNFQPWTFPFFNYSKHHLKKICSCKHVSFFLLIALSHINMELQKGAYDNKIQESLFNNCM